MDPGLLIINLATLSILLIAQGGTGATTSHHFFLPSNPQFPLPSALSLFVSAVTLPCVVGRGFCGVGPPSRKYKKSSSFRCLRGAPCVDSSSYVAKPEPVPGIRYIPPSPQLCRSCCQSQGIF